MPNVDAQIARALAARAAKVEAWKEAALITRAALPHIAADAATELGWLVEVPYAHLARLRNASFEVVSLAVHLEDRGFVRIAYHPSGADRTRVIRVAGRRGGVAVAREIRRRLLD